MFNPPFHLPEKKNTAQKWYSSIDWDNFHREKHRPGVTELPLHCYYALFECVTRAHNKVGCRVHFTVRFRGRFFASFGTQLGNHPLCMIGARLLGVDKSASSIRLTVIKCFWGCTRQPSGVPTAANIYIGFAKTDGGGQESTDHGFFDRDEIFDDSLLPYCNCN